MKKLLVLVSLLAIGLSSCSKDDDSSGSSAALEGKWIFSKEGAIVGGNEMLIDYTGNEAGCTKDYSIIKSNGTIEDVDFDSFNSPCEMFVDNYSWSRSGNTLTVGEGADSSVFEILVLTSTELKIKETTSGDITVFVRG